MTFNYAQIFRQNFELYFAEDDFHKNFGYLSSLPTHTVQCRLKIKDDMLLAGLPFLFEAFNFLSQNQIKYSDFMVHEGASF